MMRFVDQKMKKIYIISILMVLICLFPRMSTSIPYNFSSTMWSDSSPYFGENAIYISVWVGNNERVGINREDPRVELDVSGDFWCNGDATFDGSVVFGGSIDLTGDISIVGDITADNMFIITDLDVSEDLTSNTLVVAGDATFDGSVFIGTDLDVSEDLSANTLLVDTTSTLTGDATLIASCAIGVDLDVTGDITANDVTLSGDFTADNVFIITDLDVSEDLTANTFVVGDMTADNIYVNVDVDVSEDLTANTLVVAGDATFDGSMFVGTDLDVSEDLSSNTLAVTGDSTFDASVAIEVNLNVTGDFTSDNAFITTDMDVSEDLTSNTFIVGDMTADNIYVNVDMDVSEDLTANTLVVAGDATFDQSVYVLDSLDVSNDLTVSGYIGINDSTPDGTLGIVIDQTSDIGIDINTCAFQSANIIDIDDTTGDGIIEINSSGDILVGAHNSGVFTLGGTGGANNENITLDFESTAGRILLSTTTAGSLEFRKDFYIGGSQSLQILDASYLKFGSGASDVWERWVTAGNDNLQIALGVNSVNYSGYMSIVEISDISNANRSPLAVSENPVLRIYSSDANQPLDYVEAYHNGTIGVIALGNGGLNISGGVVGINDATPDGQFDITNSSAAQVALDIDGAAAQSANIVDIDDATGDELFTIAALGGVTITKGLDVTSDLTTNTIVVSGDATCDGTLYTDGLIFPASATQVIDGTDDAILANAVLVVLNPDADYTTDVTPIIADGTIGQILYVTCANGEGNRVRVRDQDSLASSNLQLGNTYRDITGKIVLMLMFDGDDWCEVNPF